MGAKGKSRGVLLLAVLGLVGCALAPSQDDLATSARPAQRSISAFSQAQPEGELPGDWRPWRLSKLKKLTSYRLTEYNGSVVLKALSDASASGLIHPVDLDPRELPILQWRWKVPQLIPGADNGRHGTEDAPVRMVLFFDGDADTLPLEERAFIDRIRALTGQQLPYATLMYIWENKAPTGSVIANPHTSRIQMVVAESGPTRTGTWKLETQNVYEDYKRAFGEEPRRIKAIGIMTDTDNTGQRVEAYYGDIAFLSAQDASRVSLAPRRQAKGPDSSF